MFDKLKSLRVEFNAFWLYDQLGPFLKYIFPIKCPLQGAIMLTDVRRNRLHVCSRFEYIFLRL